MARMSKRPTVAIIGGGRSVGKTMFLQIELLEELQSYRDAEEQGLLLRLPVELKDVDRKIIEYAISYAVGLYKYGVDIGEKYGNATEMSEALKRAYMRGRQDEIDRFNRTREEAEAKLAKMQKGN